MALKIQWGNTHINFSNLGSGRSFNWWFSSTLQFSSLVSCYLPPNLWMPTPSLPPPAPWTERFLRDYEPRKEIFSPWPQKTLAAELHKAKKYASPSQNRGPMNKGESQVCAESGVGSDHNWGRKFVGTRSWELVPHTDPLLVKCRLIHMPNHFSLLAHPYKDSRICNWFYCDIVFKTSGCWGGKFFLPPFLVLLVVLNK